jgi:MtN3 and saliva related transmembrane protein
MDYTVLIGSLAAICTTLSFVPQVVRVYRTKHTKDLSLPMYAIFSLGVFLWACYGVLEKSIPIIIANSVTLALSFYILVMKIKHK